MRHCTVHVAKTKVLISCAVTATADLHLFSHRQKSGFLMMQLNLCYMSLLCDDCIMSVIFQKMKSRARSISPHIRQIDLDVNRTYRNHIMFRERYGVK